MTDVKLKLITEIRDVDRKEEMTLSEPGKFYTRDETEVLTFTEHPEEGEPVNTMVTIKPDHISIKRTGAVDMRQVFQRKRETENIYRHTYGDFHMRTWTDQIEYRSLTEASQGRLFISYQMTLNDDVTQRHRLTLIFEEERES
ncbi:DUF1934 domain-containing protein [Halobacillus shinanisalinarum]|uniref:DUF1934 domain-containing protein n=1 Tax=Halobacillus shinanisalinarum TaxID=2932258 RepID=A0ABY4H3G1_9BACI|nr:DUF1934 domain-containing protein [Halobacillus shinanisalinarum]UOQ94992.1 DUF1934 domain-containing protein [Halobacillus shinanisalinarum]